MTCDACKQETASAGSFTWAVLPRTESWLERKQDSFFTPEYDVYRVSRGHIEPLTISLCGRCLAKARKRELVAGIVFLALLLSFSAGFLYALVVWGSHWRLEDRGSLYACLALLTLTLGLAAGLTAALVRSPKQRGSDVELEGLLKDRMIRELTRRGDELYRSRNIKQEWYYMPYAAFEKTMSGGPRPLSEADYQSFVKSSHRTGRDLNAARFGTPVASRGC